MDRIRTIRLGTTYPPLTGRLTHHGGLAGIDLAPQAGVTGLTMKARGIGTGATFSGDCTILDDGSDDLRGSWSYSLIGQAPTVADLYDVGFTIHYGVGEDEVVPESGWGQLKVEPAL